MNQMRHVVKRENLYMLSLFASKLSLFRLKYILKIKKNMPFKRRQFYAGARGVG